VLDDESVLIFDTGTVFEVLMAMNNQIVVFWLVTQ
jgi:hypothetical protein